MPAIGLPGEVWTRLIKERVAYALQRIPALKEEWLRDGSFPGTYPTSGKVQLAEMLGFTDPQDFATLLNVAYTPDETYTRITQGLVPPLVSPRWLTIMSVRPTFVKMLTAFRNLVEQQTK